MHLVREMKKYGEVRVANAIYALGWRWKKPNQRPKSVEKMVMGVPRCELEMILNKLRKG